MTLRLHNGVRQNVAWVLLRERAGAVLSMLEQARREPAGTRR